MRYSCEQYVRDDTHLIHPNCLHDRFQQTKQNRNHPKDLFLPPLSQNQIRYEPNQKNHWNKAVEYFKDNSTKQIHWNRERKVHHGYIQV